MHNPQINNFAISGLTELVKELQPEQNVEFYFVQFHNYITSCYCLLAGKNKIAIPYSSCSTNRKWCISLSDGIPDIRIKLQAFLMRECGSACGYCELMKGLKVRDLNLIYALGKFSGFHEVAESLGIGIKSVYYHQLRLKKKLGFKSRSHFLIWCKEVSDYHMMAS